MEVDQISQLADILRENGDQVLNSSSKFSLSTNLLCSLNSSFALIIEQRDSQSMFQVINNRSANTEIFRNLQFLHDFVQRTVSLKLTPNCIGSSCTEFVDIIKFKNLRLVELHKVNAALVLGLQALRTKLQFLICVRSIDSLGEVLEECGADKSQGFMWSELKEATFSHNNLADIDTSLQFTPWLHTLDLSHNKIKDAHPLNCLPNLKYLNLSYNQIEAIPVFTGQLCSRLQVLVLRNNFLEDIRQLTGLGNLCELDLSDNCLLEHELLAPLAHLSALQWLSVEGNPLSFHPQHRTRTARFLHINTGTVRFLLDRVLLSKTEKKLVGSLHPIHTSTLQKSEILPFCSTPSESTSTIADRSRRVRHATISDHDEDPDMEISIASVTSLVTSMDHLETKQKIEQLRKEYGNTWLHSQGGGSLVQDALGLEKTQPLSSSPYEKEFLLHANDIDIRPKEKSEITSEKSTNNTFTTATDSVLSENDSFYAEEQLTSPEPPSSDDDELGEGEESLYLATVKNEMEPVFVVLTSTHIWERECDSGKEKSRWPLETLWSCELLGDNCTDVRLTFDRVRKDRRERSYILEADEATRLSCVLNNMLTNHPPVSRLIVYRCLKCSAQFSNDKTRDRLESAVICPACESTVVIEDDGPQ